MSGGNIEMTLSDVERALKGGSRVVLQVRHAERPKMDPTDPTFGDALPLTAEGVRTARLLGESLAPFADSVQFLASPLRRTRMTAELVAEGMGIASPDILVDGRLGNASFYYRDMLEVLHVFTPPENFFPASIEYMNTGRMRGFNDLYESSDALESWLLGQFTSRLMVATTHDLYIAAFLSTCGAYNERSRDTWPRFLDAGAIILDPDGTRRYALVRTGLSTGIVGVKV